MLLPLQHTQSMYDEMSFKGIKAAENNLRNRIADEPSQDAPTITNKLGGRQSKVERAFHLIPPEGLAQIARVLHHGYIKYGRDNWRLIESDDHINHSLNHIYMHLAGNIHEDHLAHATTRLMMALELQITCNTTEGN